MMQSAKQLVRIGLFYLKEAILEFLFEARESHKDPYVRLTDINKELGGKWKVDGWSARELLLKLEEKGRVKQREVGGPWTLTDAEYEKRR